jgi:hypothetical protein
MHRALLLSAILFGIASQSFAADVEFQSDDAPPIRFHKAAKIIIRQGTKPIKIQSGLTPLDKGNSLINCASAAGCLITAKEWITVDAYEGAYPSAYVDGVAMNPAPTAYASWINQSAQQSAVVSQGEHKLQSQVYQQVAGGNITGWNVEYTVYESK